MTYYIGATLLIIFGDPVCTSDIMQSFSDVSMLGQLFLQTL